MVGLGRQLQQAKLAYRGMHYPGDLAGEVMGMPGVRRGGGLKPALRVMLGAVGLAAAIGLLLMLTKVENTPVTESSPMAIREAERPLGLTLPGMPEWPSGFSIVPQPPEVTQLPGMPMFPSLDSGDGRQDSATTQEKV